MKKKVHLKLHMNLQVKYISYEGSQEASEEGSEKASGKSSVGLGTYLNAGQDNEKHSDLCLVSRTTNYIQRLE